jgi:hypothetical protein
MANDPNMTGKSKKPDKEPHTNHGRPPAENAKFLRDTGLGNQYHNGRPFGK